MGKETFAAIKRKYREFDVRPSLVQPERDILASRGGRMKKLAFMGLGLLVSYTSMLRVYLSITQSPGTQQPWHWAVISGISIFVLGLYIWEVRDYWLALPHRYTRQKKIDAYMCRWLSSGGRAVVFSRDMSWAKNEPIKSMLVTKAELDELTICLEKDLPITDHLKKAGAKIITYGGYNFVPRSRFTIMDYDKEGARVAVGVHQDGKHVIQEFRSGSHPFFAVAEDLVKLLHAMKRECTNAS
jgi:hypothetical protein